MKLAEISKLLQIYGHAAGCCLQIDVDLPLSLKRVLLEEHNTLSQEDRLPHAPHHPSVADILSLYTEYSRSKEADSYASEVSFWLLSKLTLLCVW